MRRYIAFVVLLGLLLGVLVWVTSFVTEAQGLMNPLAWEEIYDLTIEHIQMVVVAEAIAIAIGVPLGILIALPQFRALSPPVLGFAGVGQSVPSLAVIAIMSPIFALLSLNSTGYWPVVVALIIYGLMPIIRNAFAGMSNVDPALIEAGRGMGMTQGQIIRQVQIPIAISVIVAGIRTSTTLNVGAATLGVLNGAGGLGEPILSGMATSTYLVTLQGGAAAAALAVIVDRLIGGVESWLTPKGLLVAQS